jgi:hypothetical protein
MTREILLGNGYLLKMKLFEIADEALEGIKGMFRKPIPMSLLGTENCLVMFNDGQRVGDHVVLRLYVDVFLDTLTLRKEMFQEIMDGTIHHLRKRQLFDQIVYKQAQELNLSIYEITLYLDKFRLKLFNFMSPADVINIKEFHSLADLVNKTANYSFVDQSVLPTIDLDYNKEHDHQERRAKNIYKAFRKGFIQGVAYTLPEEYDRIEVIHNPRKYNFEDKIIKPHFNIIITIDGENIVTTGDIPLISTKLHEKFRSFDVILKYT